MSIELKIVGDLPRSKKFGRRQSVLVPTAWVESWSGNPPVRTEERNLDELTDRLTDEIGQLVPASIVAVGKVDGQPRFRLVDGHRRYAILKLKGVEYLEAILYRDVEGGSELFGLLFEALNTATRAIGIRERVWLALTGERHAAGPDACKIGDEIAASVSAVALEKFKDHVCPIQAFKNSKSAFGLLVDKGLESNDKANRKRFLSVSLLWQFKHNEQNRMKNLITAVNQMTNQEKGKAKKTLKALNAAIAGDFGLPRESYEEASDDDDEAESTVEKVVPMPATVLVRRQGRIIHE